MLSYSSRDTSPPSSIRFACVSASLASRTRSAEPGDEGDAPAGCVRAFGPARRGDETTPSANVDRAGSNPARGVRSADFGSAGFLVGAGETAPFAGGFRGDEGGGGWGGGGCGRGCGC